MLSLNYENINDVISQILKLSCVSFRYVSISYVLANVFDINQLIVLILASSRSSGSSISASSAASTVSSLSQDGASSADGTTPQPHLSGSPHLLSNSPKANLDSPSAVAAAMFTVEALKIRQQELSQVRLFLTTKFV